SSNQSAVKYLFLPLLLISVLPACGQKPEVVISSGHTDMIHTIDISDDGNWLATGANDKLVKIIDNQTGKELRTVSDNDGYVTYVKFDKSAKYISAYLSSEQIKTWNVATGELVSVFTSSGSFAEFDFVLDNTRILFVDGN